MPVKTSYPGHFSEAEYRAAVAEQLAAKIASTRPRTIPDLMLQSGGLPPSSMSCARIRLVGRRESSRTD